MAFVQDRVQWLQSLLKRLIGTSRYQANRFKQYRSGRCPVRISARTSHVKIKDFHLTGVLISPQPDQEGNKLQRQKILIFIYPIYNHNWRNISTIYIYEYNKISIKRNILTIQQKQVGLRTYQHPCTTSLQLKPGTLTLSLAPTASSDILYNQLFTVTRTFNAAYSEIGRASLNKLRTTLQFLSYHHQMENQYNIHADARLFK